MFKPNKLKYHPYFLSQVIIRRPYLTEEKIENVLLHHETKTVQENGRIAYDGYDIDAKKFIKVVVEVSGNEQVIFNAYYNRSYKPRSART